MSQNYDSDEEEKGKKFLELIDKQSTLQQAMIARLTVLVTKHNWNSDDLKSDIQDMILEHSEITRKINGWE